MFLEELQTNPRGKMEEGGGAFDSAEEGGGGAAAGGGGGGGVGEGDPAVPQDDEDDSLVSQEPPTSIIVTNLTMDIFDEPAEREKFEATFFEIDEGVSFQYFKSFRRVRVNFATHEQASAARDKVHMTELGGEVIKGYFTQPIILGSSRGDPHLQPPAREKMFLISPPASPPVGWEPIEEAEPVVNYDLISAVASLAPGEAHELHPAVEDKPGIIVHVCEECEVCESQADGARPKIIQTRRPT